jgi:methylmalonyl-CoA mutase cobalamin-binding subunit
MCLPDRFIDHERAEEAVRPGRAERAAHRGDGADGGAAALGRFGAPPIGNWRRDSAALAKRLPEMGLSEAIGELRHINQGGLLFRPTCRDVILPAARILRRRYEDHDAFDQSERLHRVWQLRMCLHSLDDAGDRGVPAALHSALTLSGGAVMPGVEHAVALRFFDRAGWSVQDCGADQAEEACDSAHDRDYDVAWISLEPGMDPRSVRATARGVRRASRNARILVLGGGVMGVPAEEPHMLGLDGFTADAVQAAAVAEAALMRRGASALHA